MKREAKLWALIRSNLKHTTDRLDRIENLTTDGMPDVQGCFDGEEIWMELKSSKAPARPTTPVLARAGNHPLLDTQIVWFARQRRAGGVAFIVVMIDNDLFVVDGVLYADDINTWTLQDFRDKSLVSYRTPMSTEHWELMRNVLILKVRRHRNHPVKQPVKRNATVERQKLERNPDA